MAVTVITPVSLSVGTASVDLLAAGTVASTPTDGWTINTRGLAGGRVLLIFEADASGDTVTIVAGDNPPGATSGLGNGSVTLAANDIKGICVEGSRFMHNDGLLRATCTDAGTRCYALILPVGP